VFVPHHPRHRAPHRTLHRAPRLGAAAWLLAAAALAGCTAAGPDFVKPPPTAPDDWTSWRSADASLRGNALADAALPGAWWQAFGDPLLDRLQQRAVDASPDVLTATLHVAQARAQRGTVAAQAGPELKADAAISRQRQSAYGAGTRMLDALGGNREALAQFLSAPFTLYQAGFDAAWEPDLWGRVRRSLEAADADLAREAALLDLARLTLASDVARNYFELRTTQRQIRLAREEVAVMADRLGLLAAQARGGLIDDVPVERQRADLAALRAQLPALLEQEGAAINRIALLLGERPGALREELTAPAAEAHAALPSLALGLPSEVALRRPDVRAAEARLRSATAAIGIASAELYPSIRLGARVGIESYLGSRLSDWDSRTWSLGPSIDLPLFDRGRRKGVVQLRELQQQEAAVNHRQTVLRAWQEIDDALSGYAAQQQQVRELEARAQSTRAAYDLARERQAGGLVDFVVVLDAQRAELQVRRDLADAQGRLNLRYVTINKVLGNAPRGTS